MSGFKTELWQGHWYDIGYVFNTCQEAAEYGRSEPGRTYRVVPTDAPVNYTYKEGKLTPFKPLLIAQTWEDYINGMGGMP